MARVQQVSPDKSELDVVGDAPARPQIELRICRHRGRGEGADVAQEAFQLRAAWQVDRRSEAELVLRIVSFVGAPR